MDEALSVGDSYFQHKSFDRIRQFRDEGVSILLVTHSMSSICAICDRALLLDHGSVLKDGQPDEVVDYYNALVAAKENSKLSVEQRREKNGWLLTKSGTGEASAISIKLIDTQSSLEITTAQVNQLLTIKLTTYIHADIPKLVMGFLIRNKEGNIVWGSNTAHTHQIQENLKAGELLEFFMTFRCGLGHGSYSISHALHLSDTHISGNYEWVDNALIFDVINTDYDKFIGCNWLDAKFTCQRSRQLIE